MRTFFGILLLTIVMHYEGNSQTALEIIRKADDKMRGNSSYGEAVMRIVRPDWTREIGMKMWSLGTKKSLVLITSPPRDKGTATLMRDREIWNWQPSIDRVIKLPPSMMMQSWMGSDFTNDDLVKQSSIVNDYNHKILGDTVIDGYVCHIIELIPKEEAAVVWGRIKTCISKKEYFQLHVKYYDEDGFIINTMYATKIKMLDGRMMPTYMEMTPADNPKQKTVIEYSILKFDIEISDEFFSLQNLKKVR